MGRMWDDFHKEKHIANNNVLIPGSKFAKVVEFVLWVMKRPTNQGKMRSSSSLKKASDVVVALLVV